MKTKHVLTSILPLIASVAVPFSFAEDTVYFDDDFESYLLETQPTQPDDGNPNFWVFNVPPGGTENRKVEVVSTEDAGGEPTQAMRLYQVMPLSSSTQGLSMRRKFGPIFEGEFEVSFRFRLNENLHDPEISASAGTYYQFQLLDDSLRVVTNLYAILDGTDGLRDRSDTENPKPGFAIYSVPDRIHLIPQIMPEDWYQIILRVDIDSQVLSVHIENLNSDDPLQSASATGIAFRDTVTHVSEIWGGRGFTWSVIDAHVDDVLIRTAPAIDPDGFAAWQTLHFGSPEAEGAGPDQDPDGDGIRNRLEYALGGSPLQPSREPLPAVSIEADRLHLDFARPAAVEDIAYIIEASPDLFTWTPISELSAGAGGWTGEAEVVEGEEDASGMIPTTIRDVASLSGRGFLRLRVE